MTHELLACDAQSYCWGQVDVIATDDRKTSTSSSCGAPLTSTPPSFACESGADRVPYSMVCDHSRDCLDSSDEDFCHFDSCFGGTQFECSSKQVSGVVQVRSVQDPQHPHGYFAILYIYIDIYHILYVYGVECSSKQVSGVV